MAQTAERAVSAISLVLLIGSAAAGPPSQLDQTRAQLDAAEHDRAAALADQTTANHNAAAAAAEASRLEAERAQAEQRVAEAQHATAEAAARLTALDEARQEAEARVKRRAQSLGPLLPVLERLARYPAETLLAVALPPDQAVEGLSVMHALSAELAEQAAALRDEQTKLATAREALVAAAPALTAAEAAQTQAIAELTRQTALADAARHAAEEQASTDARRATALEQQAAALRDLLGKLEVEARRSATTHQRVAMAVPLHAPSRLDRPVMGPVIRRFGDAGEAGPAEGISYHTGPAAAVLAPCAGEVMFAAPFRSYRQLVILDCGGGTLVVLAGLDRLAVKVSAATKSGMSVGQMASDGGTLYMELRRQGRPVDPSLVLGTS
jgi:murein hydrolase activator